LGRIARRGEIGFPLSGTPSNHIPELKRQIMATQFVSRSNRGKTHRAKGEDSSAAKNQAQRGDAVPQKKTASDFSPAARETDLICSLFAFEGIPILRQHRVGYAPPNRDRIHR
jgi:hypothetical protein